VTASDPVAVDVVCHHDRPDSALLLDAALPAARLAAGTGVLAHVERHWLHGPHVRVRLHGPPRVVRELVGPVRARFTRHVATRPVPPPLDPADLLARAVVAGRAELVPGPYEPFHPHGTVRVERPDEAPLAELLGSAAAVGHRRRLMADALDAVEVSTRLLRAERDTPGVRVRVALAALTAHAAGYPQGIAAGSTSYLSHVEDLLHRADPDGRIRERFAAVWRRTGDRVTEAVRSAAQGDPPDALHAAWSDWSAGAAAVCRPAFARGDIPLVPGDGHRDRARRVGDDATAVQWDHGRRTDYSEFHRRVGPDWPARIAADLGPYRFATNVLYPVLAACGVQPLDRYLAGYLVAEATQRLAGRTWRDPRGWPPSPPPPVTAGSTR
jgi:hypothetical protein